jgi:putative tryptophan/tyrosine transport system substrate-binding protein
MHRRNFITLLGAAAFPRAACAGEAGRLPVVGVVFALSPVTEMAGPEPVAPSMRALLQGLSERGWVEGRTVTIERRSLEGHPERAPSIFADLAARGVDVIQYTLTRASYDAANKATRTIPMVAIFLTDPVADGLIASLARPGGNLTGVTDDTGPEFAAKRLQLLKEMAPGIARVAFIGERETFESYMRHPAAEPPAFFAQVDRPEQFDEAFAAIERERIDALYVLDGAIYVNHRGRVLSFAAAHRLPAIYPDRAAVDEGGLMSYADTRLLEGVYRQIAGIVDKILKGAKPADIPVERPTKFELVINARTARALGLTIPPLLLARAAEVIE